MLFILGSIVETSLKNMYVRKPIKEEYTFETEIYKATSQSVCADDPPKPAPLSPLHGYTGSVKYWVLLIEDVFLFLQLLFQTFIATETFLIAGLQLF